MADFRHSHKLKLGADWPSVMCVLHRLHLPPRFRLSSCIAQSAPLATSSSGIWETLKTNLIRIIGTGKIIIAVGRCNTIPLLPPTHLLHRLLFTSRSAGRSPSKSLLSLDRCEGGSFSWDAGRILHTGIVGDAADTRRRTSSLSPSLSLHLPLSISLSPLLSLPLSPLSAAVKIKSEVIKPDKRNLGLTASYHTVPAES